MFHDLAYVEKDIFAQDSLRARIAKSIQYLQFVTIVVVGICVCLPVHVVHTWLLTYVYHCELTLALKNLGRLTNVFTNKLDTRCHSEDQRWTS